MRQGVFQMIPIDHLVRADLDAVVGVEATEVLDGTASAPHVAVVDVAAELVDLFAQEEDDGTW